MNILFMIILGGIAGWLASMIASGHGRGLIVDIVLGIVGAVVGGLIMGVFGQPGVTGFDLWSVVVSVLGAIVVIYVGRLLTSGWSRA